MRERSTTDKKDLFLEETNRDKRKTLNDFLTELKFEEDEIADTLAIYDKISAYPEAISTFDLVYIPYRDSHILNFDVFMFVLQRVTDITGLKRIEVNLPLSMLIGAHSRYFYEKIGVPYEIYYDSMMDFKWKLREARQVNGITGLRPAEWYKNWYYAYRFTFGRLQFEIAPNVIDYKSENFDVKKGQTVVKIHIPADTTKAFSPENCEAAYDMARKYYEGILGKGNVIFCCTSWLLLPAHSQILPETSNIRKFAESFEIAKTAETNGDLWRIFYTDDIPEDPTKLNEDTSLQRAYKKFIIDGGKPGWAAGFRR